MHYGFTLVEMMISVVVSGIVMAAVYQLLIGQSRSYGQQRELMDVHQTLRSAGALLAWEMRQASALDGDISAIGANSITLRAVQGGGIVCAKHITLPWTALGMTWGDFNATVDDSAMVYSAGADSWLVGPVVQAGTIPLVPFCDWGGGTSFSTEVVVEVAVAGAWTQTDFDAYCNTLGGSQQINCLAEPDWPTWCAGLGGIPQADCLAALAASGVGAGIYEIGAPIRAFRRVEYGLYADAGRWWLGRKVGAAASYEKLIGPLLAPSSGGLVFTYRDAAGNVTADPTQVVVIDFVIRAESYHVSGSTFDFRQDTVAISVALRG